MLNPRLKKLCLVFSFMGHKERVSIVKEYDRRSLYPMVLQCYHPMA
jgi:hypothetical protein